MKKLALALLVVGLVLTALPARADLTFQTKLNETTHYMRVAEHKIAMETGDKNLIFRGDKKLLWVVDPAGKKYIEMTQEDAKAMGQKVGDAMAKLRERMKDLPPQQQAMIEKTMSTKMTHAAPKRTVKPLNQSKTINGFVCQGYQAISDGNELEIWSADPKVLKINVKDMSVFKELAEFMTSSFPGMDQMMDMAKDFDHPRADQVPGVPILTIGKGKDGAETWRAEVVKIDSALVADSYFELPDGFTKSTPPTGE